MQAKNPKDQYLLLKALNEVIVSLSTGLTGKELSSGHQQEVWCMPMRCIPAIALADTIKLVLACKLSVFCPTDC